MAKKKAFLPDMYVQIDVKEINDTHVICNMYTGVLCAKMIISRADYDYLKVKGFFIRNSEIIDSAGIVNTTKVFE